jgi:hypothetical protein
VCGHVPVSDASAAVLRFTARPLRAAVVLRALAVRARIGHLTYEHRARGPWWRRSHTVTVCGSARGLDTFTGTTCEHPRLRCARISVQRYPAAR